MKATKGLIYRVAFVLAILSTGFFVFNMAAMPIFKKQVFLERETITSGGEMAILIGFVFVLLFNMISLLWVSLCIRTPQAVRKGDGWILALGVLCLILMAGEKVLADEIGREYRQGLEVVGEWIILYVFLTIQLLYNFVILRRVYRAYSARRSEVTT